MHEKNFDRMINLLEDIMKDFKEEIGDSHMERFFNSGEFILAFETAQSLAISKKEMYKELSNKVSEIYNIVKSDLDEEIIERQKILSSNI